MKKIFFPLFFGAAIALTLTGCTSVSLDYVGKTYPPTTNVDIFMDPADIDRDYEVMGSAIAKDVGFANFQKLQQKAMEDAMMHGADAILIESMDEVVTGSTSSTTGSVNKSDDKKDTNYRENTNNYQRTQEVLTVKLLKYRS